MTNTRADRSGRPHQEPRRWPGLRGLLLSSPSSSRVIPEALTFLDPIERICAAPVPRFLRATHVLIGGLFVTLLLVAALVKVDVVVTGTGRLATDTATIVLQPMERGILREMKVKPGDAVIKGQLLATLDPTFAHADQVSLSDQLRAVNAQLRRLDAEAAGSGSRFGLPLQADADEVLQMALYRERQAEYRSHVLMFDEDIERLRANLQTTQDDRAALSRQLEIARAVEAMRETLLAHQTGSKLQYLDAVSVRLRAEHDLLGAVDRLAELRHGLQSRSAEREGFVDGWRRELSENLVAARAEAEKITEALAKSSRLSELVVVTAPEDGVVLEVAPRSGGSVLREAEPLVTIIPSHASLIAEIAISSRDVGYLVPGVPAEIKIDAFPYQRHGALRGRLLSVSEQSVPGPNGAEAFHHGRVELFGRKLDWMPQEGRLFPGMTLIAEIKVGSRSALAYFLTPITRGFRESMREP